MSRSAEAKAMYEPPPTGFPPILMTVDYASELPGLLGPSASIKDKRLHLRTSIVEGNLGYPASQRSFRDVIVEARVALVEGGEGDFYGLFLRQSSADAYYCFSMSPSGRCVVSRYDGSYHAVVDGVLAPDMTFHAGLGRPNLFQVVACGPSLTFILNHKVITGITVDPQYKEGLLGFYLHHGYRLAAAELAVDWIQVRAMLPERRS